MQQATQTGTEVIMQRSGSLLVMMMVTVTGLAALAAPAQAQSQPVVTAEVSYPFNTPGSAEAGQSIGYRIQATIAADAPGDAVATVDPLGVGHSTFVLKVDKSTYYGIDTCPADKQCFNGGFQLDVRLAPGRHQFPLTITDSKNRSTTIQVPFTSTPPADRDGDGLPDVWQSEFTLTGGANGDPDGDGVSNIDEFRAGTSPIDKYTRLFAEGSSGAAQPLANCMLFTPLTEATTGTTAVRVVYVGDGGRVAIEQGHAARYAFSVCPLWRAVPDRVVEIRVESLVPLAVERDTTSGTSPGPNPAYPAPQLANASFGVQSPSRSWVFADGHTGDGIDMFLLLFNPTSAPVTANLSYVRAPSTVVAQTSQVLPPGVRTTIWVNKDQQDVAAIGDVSVLLNASDGILAERAFRYHAPGRTVPHDSVTRGAFLTSTSWYFPDMGGLGAYTSSLVVMNPTSTPTRVTVTVQSPGAVPTHLDIALTGNERRELTIRDLPTPYNSSFGLILESSNGVGIVAERVAAGSTESGGWRRSAIGATAASTKWIFATAATGFNDTDLVVMNVSNFTARVRIRSVNYGFECCDTTDNTVEVPARATVHVPMGVNDPARTISVPVGVLTVESVANLNDVVAQIVVERTTYWDQDGVRHSRATSILGNQAQ